MVGNIGSEIKTNASEKVGQTGSVDPSENVAAEVESFHARIDAVKQDAAANASSGDAMIARGNELVVEGEQELDEKGTVGGLITAVPDALENSTEDVPVVNAVTGLVSDVADGLGHFADEALSGFGLFGGEEEQAPPPPPPPQNVAGGDLNTDAALAPEAQYYEEDGSPEEKINLGNQLIAEGEALNETNEGTT
ncbi:MAG: hypothetical protein HRT47_05785 [Candidatus Caenarcaniphilales bacterium]|nr:hypothetical protein [Candidatus Caenarcaniphilales bacterium]